MFAYKVGDTVREFANHAEGVYFNLDDAGATITVFFQDPEKYEIEQFESGHRFEIRMTELYGLMVFVIKVGSLNWMDAIYTPHLSPQLSQINLPEPGQGLATVLMLVNARTGEIKHLRFMSLSENFSRKLMILADVKKKAPFDRVGHFQTVNRIYATYPTERLVKLCKDYCKIEL